VSAACLGRKVKIILLLVLMVPELLAQERKVDPTWLYRYIPHLSEAGVIWHPGLATTNQSLARVTRRIDSCEA
jgi:hypothetical protein